MSISKLLVAIIAAFGAFALIAEPNAAYTENTTVDAALELDGEYIIDVASGVTVTYSGEISGTGPLRKTGAGTLVLANGNNTFTEGVQIKGMSAPMPQGAWEKVSFTFPELLFDR